MPCLPVACFSCLWVLSLLKRGSDFSQHVEWFYLYLYLYLYIFVCICIWIGSCTWFRFQFQSCMSGARSKESNQCPGLTLTCTHTQLCIHICIFCICISYPHLIAPLYSISLNLGLHIPFICHFFTQTKFLENKIYTNKTRNLRQNTQ